MVKLIDLVENYKGTVSFDVKDINDEGETVNIVSFDIDEKDAIKENILQSEVQYYRAICSNTMPPKATIEVTIKEISSGSSI